MGNNAKYIPGWNEEIHTRCLADTASYHVHMLYRLLRFQCNFLRRSNCKGNYN